MSTKKFNSRVAATALAMATMASMLAIPANAADYGTNPKYSEPSYADILGTGGIGGGSGGANSLYVGANAGGNGSGITTPATPSPVEIVGKPSVTKDRGSVLTDSAVSDAVKDATAAGDVIASVDMQEDKSGNVTLREDTLAALASGDVALSLNVKANSSKNMDYTVTVIPGLVEKVDGSVNLAMKVRKVKKISSVRGVKIPSNSVVVSAKAQADLGMAVAVTLPKDALDGLKQSQLSVYAIDADGAVVDLGSDYILVGPDGSVTVALEDASTTLVISDKDIAAAAARHA
jgi:Cu/Ag efflux protein CusF